jgi:hypothetical protein
MTDTQILQWVATHLVSFNQGIHHIEMSYYDDHGDFQTERMPVMTEEEEQEWLVDSEDRRDFMHLKLIIFKVIREEKVSNGK